MFHDYIVAAHLLAAPQRHHVDKSAALGHVKERTLLAGIFVWNVSDKEENEGVIIVLRGVPAPAELVATWRLLMREEQKSDGYWLKR